MSKVAAIVVAAGKSRRMKGGPNKVFLDLAGRPILSYCLATFESCEDVQRVVLVTSERDEHGAEEFLDEHHFEKVQRPVVRGGEERCDSVLNGLRALQENPPDVVLIHDGARPFMTEDMIRSSVNALRDADGSIVSVPATDTIKEVDDGQAIRKTLQRARLWCAQTPQTFQYDKILKAYESLNSSDGAPTDDGSLMEMSGGKVVVVEGDYSNIKVTTPLDLTIAEAILKQRNLEA